MGRLIDKCKSLTFETLHLKIKKRLEEHVLTQLLKLVDMLTCLSE